MTASSYTWPWLLRIEIAACIFPGAKRLGFSYTEKIMDHERRNASDLLNGVVNHHTEDIITVGQVKAALHERGFGVIMAIASLPLCLPVPVPPGYTLLFSIPLFIFSIQMILGQDSPWLPQWLTRKKIQRQALARLVEKAVPLLRRIERLMKPRMRFASSRAGEKLIGVFAFVFALSIALPIPVPFTNLLPGLGILVMSLGLLSKDGLTIITGMIMGSIGCGLLILVLLLGQQAVIKLLSLQ